MPETLILNKDQQKAVDHINGPLLILAGAGAGKTRTIVHRIHNLIQNGVSPDNILAVTFTNKAATEMRDRVVHLISTTPSINRPISINSFPFVATFHALCAYILRENADAINLSRHFTIMDRSDSVKAIKQAMKECGFDPAQIEPRKILGTISKQKGNVVSLEQFRENSLGDYYPALVADVWEGYERQVREEGALDFDDLLLETVLFLKNNPDIQKRYQNRWQYIHIDEYQDTNKVQDEVAFLLTSENKNICVVGDVDQTIYTWRGAHLANMMAFDKKYLGATCIQLTENYRSTKNIIEASNQIIEKNIERPKKHLFTRNDVGEKLSLYGAYDETDEARFVVSKASELIDNGTRAKEIAVLYRANFQSRILEEMFLEAGIPYQLLGTRFFDRKEVKDVLALLRASLNEASVADLKRIVNVPPRGIGKVTLMRMVTNREYECTNAVRKKINDFRALLKKIAHVANTESASNTIRYVITESGFEKYLKEREEENAERLENIYELVGLAQKYDILPPSEGIPQLLSDAALATDQDTLSKNTDSVKLMTVHSAKGLEFDHVFVTGLESGLFPHEGVFGEDRDEEEERRLFYVALTRARKKVCLSYTSSRTIYGTPQLNIPSEFITDIDESLLSVENERPPEEKIFYLEDY